MTQIQNPSLPKDKIKVLLLEGISETAAEDMRAAGYTNIERLTRALEGPALIEALADVRILGIRSRTQMTAEALNSATRLIAVGCFSVGTNQIDLLAAQRQGVPVFNAPFSNTRSVAELTIAEIVMLFRRTFPRSMAAHTGGWDKSATRSREKAPEDRRAARREEKPSASSATAISAASWPCSPRAWAFASSTSITPTNSDTAT